MNETLASIRNRRSIRRFKPEPIPDEAVQAIVEAAIYAPSAVNQQAWHFTVIQNKALLDTLAEDARTAILQVADERFRQLASREDFHVFYHAPTVILVSGQEEAHGIQLDCGAANQNMLLAAESLGLGSCWINLVLFAFEGPNGARHRLTLGIPEGYQPVCSVALGYRNMEPPSAPERKPNLVNYVR